MARLIPSILIVLILSAPCLHAESPDHSPYHIDWHRMELRVSGHGAVSAQDRGNMIEWQLETVRYANQNLLRNFIEALKYLQVDAFQSAHDIIIQDLVRNERMFRYSDFVTEASIRYGDDDVTVTKVFPFFGEDGFADILFRAGKDTGNFPTFGNIYVASADFTGLVIDARNLDRVPAFAPRVFDEDHELIYAADLEKRESFERWGAVQYTDDPRYRDFTERVGANPLKIVARGDDKLMAADISIFTEDAQILLDRASTRRALEEGRVIIILDEDRL